MDEIAQIRRFNRTVTHRLGVLEDHFLGRNRSIGASRVLFEIGLSGIDVRDLRQRLELDSGYASRLLRSLEAEKLVQVDQSERDARVRFARLTVAGQGELVTLNRLSDEIASSMLDHLSEKQRHLLTEAMGTVEQLLRVTSITIAVEEPSGRRAQDCIAHYFADLDAHFEGGFNPETSNSATEKNDAADGYLAIADLFGKAVGCGALKCHPDFGEIKRVGLSLGTWARPGPKNPTVPRGSRPAARAAVATA